MQQKKIVSINCELNNTLLSLLSKNNKIVISDSVGYVCLDIENILYIKGVGNYSEITLNDGSKKLMSKTLKIYESLLPSDIFYRIHKSYLVNVRKITKLLPSSSVQNVQVSNGDLLPLSRPKKKSVFLEIKQKTA